MAGPAFDYVLPLEDWIQTGVEWVVDHWRPFFQAIRWPIAQTLDAMEGFLLDVTVSGVPDRPRPAGLADRRLEGRCLQRGRHVLHRASSDCGSSR